MNYNFYTPEEVCFKNVIQSIWQIDHVTTHQKEYIIPKGIVEVIFNFSGSSPILAKFENDSYHLPNCFINGFNTAPIAIRLPQQQVFFGVVFQPMATRKIFGSPACEFSDITVDLTLLDPTFNSLWHQLAEQDSFDKRLRVFLGWARKKIIEWQPREQLINNFLYAVNQHDLSIKELAGSLCYSPRQLTRKIVEATGMNTEEIMLYKKYLHAVHLIHHSGLSLTAIAYQCGFSDQSHFIKSFRHFTKMTPGEYRLIKSLVKGHVFEDVR